jgi:YD repeat-containing protein
MDGQSKCTIQNGVIKTWNDYGVNPDGTQWSITYTGPLGSNSPMWQKTTTDLLGRTIRTERPGFSSVPSVISVVTNSSFYNSIGQLVRTTAPGSADTLYYYDILGNQIRSGLDLDGSGALEINGVDRVNDSDVSYWTDSTNWWQVSTSVLYAGNNSAMPTTNSVQRTRLTFTGGPTSVSAESVSIDLLGNQTVSQTAIDRPNKTVTQTAIYPDSTNAAVSVSFNGLTQYSISKTGVKTSLGYDAIGRQVATIDPRTGASTTHYNVLGQGEHWGQVSLYNNCRIPL